jgi:signal transduction histidine kinase
MFGRLSLLSKIWLSTSVALTGMFAVAGWLLQRHAIESTSRSLHEEVAASFQAYESVWRARSEMLRSVAATLASLPNVRAAFGTRDRATIRDSAGELWDTVSTHIKESAFFLVADPQGNTIASLDDRSPTALPARWMVIGAVSSQFPKQASGFFLHEGQLFSVVITPVYVDSARGRALINLLVAGYPVNHVAAARLKESTGGSEFLFLSSDRVFASTLNDRATTELAQNLQKPQHEGLVSDGVAEYAPLMRDLIDLQGKVAGRLVILRSFEAARQRISILRRDLVLLWLAAIAAGLALTYVLARRIVRPVETLDRAAAEVALQNYELSVPVEGTDELGRLATTFNSMCESLRAARQELIRRERISTIGRLASSIAHDLRNPLAAIYGGAEMMVDTDLTTEQMKRLAANIYRASRRIQELLIELTDVSRGKTGSAEHCRLSDVVGAAVDSQASAAEGQGVALTIAVPEDIELPLERGRMERVFLNLIGNALEAMPRGGEIRIAAQRDGEEAVIIQVSDNGPGISDQVRRNLFQPFVSFGKKNGLGLGLALSRQTVLDHGGDMWVKSEPGKGAHFYLRLPLVRATATAAV